ncbi:MAG TPA: hypothetical protein VI299_27365 [Polyangiales bacterium]
MPSKDSGLVARSVREALGMLVSPQMYAQLVARALASAGLSAIPEQGREVGNWIRGPLAREIENAVGSDAAEMVTEQLAPVIAHSAASEKVVAPRASVNPRPAPFTSELPTGVVAAGGRRQELSTTRHELTPEQLAKMNEAGHTARPGALALEERELTRVLFASSARAQLEPLQGYLDGTAEVALITDLVGLLDALDDKSLVDPIVLLDCQKPSVHVSSIAAIGEDMPVGTTIVLWGIGDDAWNQLDRDRTANCRWVRCSHEATTGDVGSLVSMLIRQH